MSNRISWTDQTWNPVVGCSHVSPGCDHCWAERMARLHYHPKFPNGWNGEILYFSYRISEMLHRHKPMRIAVGLMGDLFHEKVDFRFIEKVFEVMRQKESFEFQLLTKRPQRVLDYWQWRSDKWIPGQQSIWPKHVWLGVSCENQATADERIPLLLQTPAAVKWVSCEPLLGPLDLVPYLHDFPEDYSDPQQIRHGYRRLSWCVVGGESGPGARPCHPNWVRSLRDQADSTGVSFHFKQWGEWAPCPLPIVPVKPWGIVMPMGSYIGWNNALGNEIDEGGAAMHRIGKKAAGRLLDGREWLEFPEGK